MSKETRTTIAKAIDYVIAALIIMITFSFVLA